MSDKITKLPQIRFSGFTDAWEQHKLGDLMEISSASRVHKDEWTESGVPFFRSSDVVSEFKGTENNKAFISQSLFEKLSIKSGRVKKGDVLVTGGGSIGIPYLVKNDNPLYFKDADLLWLKSSEIINGTFLYTFFTTTYFRKYVNSITHIGTISHYTIEQAKFTPIRIPKKGEQTKIGYFFKLLDETITLHKRNLELLKDMKKSLLQKMFPKDGANVPEIRFAGFTDAWEQLTVSELANRYDNLRVPITASERVAGSTPYYGANGIQDYVEGFTHDGEFILVAEDGASDLQNYPVQYVNGKVWVNNHAHVLQAKPEIADNKFLMNALKHTNIEPYLVGGGRAKLNADVMMKISFRVPELAEQKQIGSFFENLDHLTTLHQRELNLLENLKKSLLQQMFI
ncbi:restriction endonuclease subunit S [Bacillus pumilus]|uniref:restriction endonuclease subunit S n=1 Tax=Bacillus pumilus TaxID=1408 RepID=UPI003879845B